MKALYDKIGINYAAKRSTDSRIEKQLHSHSLKNIILE